MAQPPDPGAPADPPYLPPLDPIGSASAGDRLRDAWERIPPAHRPAVAIGLVVSLLAALAVWWVARPGEPPPEVVLPHAGEAAAAEPIDVVVHVAGAVLRPGLYRLADPARVADLIDAAGGPAPDADVDRLNLAAGVRDGERVYVPRVGEPMPPGAAGAASEEGGPIDLNTATQRDLETLPGVGPTTASAIVAWREEHGPFTSVEQLLEVRGIGPAKLDALRDLVRV